MQQQSFVNNMSSPDAYRLIKGDNFVDSYLIHEARPVRAGAYAPCKNASGVFVRVRRHSFKETSLVGTLSRPLTLISNAGFPVEPIGQVTCP